MCIRDSPDPTDDLVDQVLLMCDMRMPGGTICGEFYHDAAGTVTAITNQCPWCKNAYSSKRSARDHVLAPFARGRCDATMSSSILNLIVFFAKFVAESAPVWKHATR
eukprot:8646985-Pyramimonas_sp.AAC.1